MPDQAKHQPLAQGHRQALQKQQGLIWGEACFHPVQALPLMLIPPPLKNLPYHQMWRNLLGQHQQSPIFQWAPPPRVVEFNVLSAWAEGMS